MSIRKTVEFISERVASACVKQICNEIVPPYKKKVLADLKDLLNLFNVPDDINADHEEFTKIKVNKKLYSVFVTNEKWFIRQ